MKLACFASIVALTAGCHVVEDGSPAESCRRSPEHASRVETFLVVGHRGSASKEVENTIPSMERALADGANAVEIDLSLTKDGVVVLWHDWDPDDAIALSRQSGAESNQRARPRVPPKGDPLRRPVDELTLEELRAHFGYTVDDRPAPVEIPTLHTFLAWASTKTELAYVLFDLKIPEDRADRADAMIPKVREEVLATAPGLRYVMLVAHGAVYVTCDLDARDSSSPPVAPKKVFVATIDDREQAECLIDMGVDGILANDPASLRMLADRRRGLSR